MSNKDDNQDMEPVVEGQIVDIRAVQIYLGHVSISNTAIYARFNEKQFVGMWE